MTLKAICGKRNQIILKKCGQAGACQAVLEAPWGLPGRFGNLPGRPGSLPNRPGPCQAVLEACQAALEACQAVLAACQAVLGPVWKRSKWGS